MSTLTPRSIVRSMHSLEAFLVSGYDDYDLRLAVAATRDDERILRETLYAIPGIRNSKSSLVLRQLNMG